MLTKTIIENILIIAAESFWMLSNFAQLRRLIKTKDRLGLSAPNQTLNAAGNIAWITYFLSRHLPVPAVTNLVLLCLTLATLFYLLGNQKQFRRGIAALLVVGPLTSYIILAHASAAGWAGVAYNFVAQLPWLVHVVRTKKTSGISAGALLFIYGAIFCTFTYALLITSLPLLVGTMTGIINTTIITRYYFRYRGKPKSAKMPRLLVRRTW